MSTMSRNPVTARELAAAPCAFRDELVRGEVRPMTPPGFRHAVVAQRLAEIVGPWVRDHGLGIYLGSEAGFWIERDPDTVRAPDGAFLTAERAALIGCPSGYVEGPPDLAVEVLSPNDRPTDVRAKARQWVVVGAAIAIVLDPEKRTASVFTAAGVVDIGTGDELRFDPVIPGLRIALARLFP
jgi:Uma2 family endonuclease